MERPFALIFETLADILKPDHLVKTYLQLVNHEDHNVRISCISLVINMHHLLRERGYPLFCDMLMTGPIQTLASDSVAEVREALLEQISFVGQHLEELEPSLAKEELVPILKELASDESQQTRINLCSKLSKFSSVLGETEILPLYVKLLKDSEPNVREMTIRNLKDLLKEFNGKAFIQKLMDEAIPSLLSDQWDQVREALAEQISLIGNHMDPSLVKEKLLPIIEALRTDPSNTVRRRTMESLSVMKYISVQVNIARPHHSHVAMTPYRTPSTFGTPSITELLATTPRRQYPASCPPSSRSISSETNQNPKTPTNPFATSMSHRESGAVPLFPSGGAHPIDNEEDIFLFGSHRRSIFEHQKHDAFNSDSHSSRDFKDDGDDHRHSDGRGGWNEEEEEKRLDEEEDEFFHAMSRGDLAKMSWMSGGDLDVVRCLNRILSFKKLEDLDTIQCCADFMANCLSKREFFEVAPNFGFIIFDGKVLGEHIGDEGLEWKWKQQCHKIHGCGIGENKKRLWKWQNPVLQKYGIKIENGCLISMHKDIDIGGGGSFAFPSGYLKLRLSLRPNRSNSHHFDPQQ